MKKILIIFAQLSEAQATIKRLNARVVEGEVASVWSEGRVPCCYRFKQGEIVISGVGVHRAQMAVARYGICVDEVWNLGLAGALNEDLPIGEMYAVEGVGKYTFMQEGILDTLSQECLATVLPYFSLDVETQAHRLISSDFPIHHPLQKQNLKKNWDLVDMEGYGIAFASSHLNKRCRMWKIVSDFASPGGRELIRKHKAILAEKIANTIEELLWQDNKQ